MKRCRARGAVLGGVVLTLITALCIYAVIRKFSFSEVFGEIAGASPLWLLPALFCMFFFFFSEGLNIGRGLSLAGYGPNPLNRLKYALTGFFFSSITPSSSGGQPMQLYAMRKDGIRLSHGSFALLLELLSFQFASLCYGGAALIGCLLIKSFSDINGALLAVFIVGMALKTLLFFGILSLMFSKGFMKPLAQLILRLSDLLPGNKDGRRRAFVRMAAEYRAAAKKLREKKTALLPMLGTSMLQVAAFYSIPYFVYRSLGLHGSSWAAFFLREGMLYSSVSAIPLPGASGAMEGGFALFFSGLFEGSLMGSAILLSRFCSFFFPLFVGGAGLVFFKLRDIISGQGAANSEPEARFERRTPAVLPLYNREGGEGLKYGYEMDREARRRDARGI